MALVLLPLQACGHSCDTMAASYSLDSVTNLWSIFIGRRIMKEKSK